MPVGYDYLLFLNGFFDVGVIIARQNLFVKCFFCFFLIFAMLSIFVGKGKAILANLHNKNAVGSV